MRNKVVIFGVGGHSKVIADIIEKQRSFELIGIVPINTTCDTDSIFGYKVIQEDNFFVEYLGSIYGGVVAIGDNNIRSNVVDKIVAVCPGFNFITAIHPNACVARNVSIGEGTVVMAGGIINCDSVIGNHCIINTNASIDHDNCIGNYVSVAPGVSTGGRVCIGDYSAICLGAKIIDKIDVGNHCIIGAGAVVVNHIESGTVQYGIPARYVRNSH